MVWTCSKSTNLSQVFKSYSNVSLLTLNSWINSCMVKNFEFNTENIDPESIKQWKDLNYIKRKQNHDIATIE